MSAPRGPRGRGRGRGRGGQNFFGQPQEQSDGDLAMSDAREGNFRGRGRGYRGGQNFQNHQQYDAHGDQTMQQSNNFDNSNFRGRGRGRGRGQGFQNHQNHHQDHRPGGERDIPENDLTALLKRFLERRYDANAKLLNLSNIASDEEVRSTGMFDSEKTQKKFFPVLMIVCDNMLPSREEKMAAIESVTLSNNNVPNLNAIYELVKYMNHIKNLDLSGNSFATLGPLKPWKNRFKSLEHLIVDPFPDPNWEEELTDWFPRLKILNDKQVRPDNKPQAGGLPINNNNNVPAVPMNTPQPPMMAPQVPINEEQQKKEEMVAFVQQATNLKRDFAIQCLEAGQWDLQRASDLFAQSRQTLPPEAFN